MATHSATYTLNAWVIGGRHRHHRQHDHFGADSDLYYAIDAPIGPWPAGTPVKFVMQDIYARLTNLSSSHHNVRVFHVDAYVLAPTVSGGLSVLWLNAVVKKTRSSSFVVDSWITKGGKFTIDAQVKGTGRFYLNAYVV